VSYSVYLLHAIVLQVFVHVWPHADARAPLTRLGIGVLFLGVVLVVAWLSYRLVEVPAQRLGRRVVRVLDARFGVSRMSASVAPGPPQSDPVRPTADAEAATPSARAGQNAV
jgi:peptidoglycan/LPS O-acetylase OafA/YrhL